MRIIEKHNEVASIFQNLQHLKNFFKHFLPFQPFGGQAGFALLFSKVIKRNNF
jgi:hypothetical protein